MIKEMKIVNLNEFVSEYNSCLWFNKDLWFDKVLLVLEERLDIIGWDLHSYVFTKPNMCERREDDDNRKVISRVYHTKFEFSRNSCTSFCAFVKEDGDINIKSLLSFINNNYDRLLCDFVTNIVTKTDLNTLHMDLVNTKFITQDCIQYSVLLGLHISDMKVGKIVYKDNQFRNDADRENFIYSFRFNREVVDKIESIANESDELFKCDGIYFSSVKSKIANLTKSASKVKVYNCKVSKCGSKNTSGSENTKCLPSEDVDKFLSKFDKNIKDIKKVDKDLSKSSESGNNDVNNLNVF